MPEHSQNARQMDSWSSRRTLRLGAKSATLACQTQASRVRQEILVPSGDRSCWSALLRSTQGAVFTAALALVLLNVWVTACTPGLVQPPITDKSLQSYDGKQKRGISSVWPHWKMDLRGLSLNVFVPLPGPGRFWSGDSLDNGQDWGKATEGSRLA